MEIEKFKIKRGPSVEQRPFVRASLDGTGCGISTCGSSLGHYITVSDGTNGVKITLTEAEARAIRSGWADITLDKTSNLR